ncbi:T9SS type A sorting domain-containing protein [Pedobacter sp. SD-b]|uniref:T9SS type A sorting domain-containing protein n=1 Tax=Pedobacter segetis TaxID=2793069 RepID=A0ABS1BGB0_9SPHI|nr:two-component regulator propeller domain-containing protein [Pedobacter segetis]MBK0381883.1 T9SS type A sorting domain-containing protein [Pedobacter segetis]
MKKILCYFILLYSSICNAQQVPLGQWRTHLPYNQVLSVAESATQTFCATTGGIFSVDNKTGELRKLSTIDGLSDVKSTLLAYNTATQQTLIAYQNSKIDLLKNNEITHLNEIFDKKGLGNKTINAVTFKDQFAYLSCGFGIVVYDLERKEVKDTYFIGSLASNLEIFEIAIDDQNIYAATADGIYVNRLDNAAITDASTWFKQGVSQGYPGGISKSITSFNGSIYGVFDKGIYKFKNNAWQPTNIFAPNVYKLKTCKNQLLSIAKFRIISYDDNENINKNIQNTANFSNANDAIINQENEFLIADGNKGLVKTTDGNSFDFVLPNGPNTTSVQNLNFNNGRVVLSPGTISQNISPGFNNDGFSIFENETWKSYSSTNTPAFNPIRDLVISAPLASSKNIFLGSFLNGVLDFNTENSTLKIYDQNNSSLQTTIGDPSTIRISGLAFDSDGKLWVTQYGVSKPLSVKTKDNQWTAYGFPNEIPDPFASVTKLLIDQEDNKWLSIRNAGLLIFNGSISKKLGFNLNNGGIPGSNVNALTLDKDGAIWIGTDQGVAVVYNPDNAFNGQNVEIPNLIDGKFLKPLLATENVNCISVDGANRKWIGTNNGVWLFSADGSKQILNFNTNNSPLLNNAVLSIAINDETGEVFMGTASGIISYRGDATEPVSKMKKVIAYPNPVRPGYTGTIGIKGLANNVSVKITDINGNLVYETTANGGTATWNGKNFNGQAASTGVYLILVVNKDGSDTAVSKILIVR